MEQAGLTISSLNLKAKNRLTKILFVDLQRSRHITKFLSYWRSSLFLSKKEERHLIFRIIGLEKAAQLFLVKF